MTHNRTGRNLTSAERARGFLGCVSAYGRDQFISFAVNNPSPDCWYQYGSYWFYPISDLPHVDERSKLILMYREPRKKHDQYVVGFFDGIAVQMSEKEFHEAMEKHEQMTVSANKLIKPSREGIGFVCAYY